MTSITRLKKRSQSLRLDITAAYSKGGRLQQPKSSTKCTQTTRNADHRVIASLTSYSPLLPALAEANEIKVLEINAT